MPSSVSLTKAPVAASTIWTDVRRVPLAVLAVTAASWIVPVPRKSPKARAWRVSPSGSRRVETLRMTPGVTR